MEKNYECKYAHFGCAEYPGGPCGDEEAAERDAKADRAIADAHRAEIVAKLRAGTPSDDPNDRHDADPKVRCGCNSCQESKARTQ